VCGRIDGDVDDSVRIIVEIDGIDRRAFHVGHPANDVERRNPFRRHAGRTVDNGGSETAQRRRSDAGVGR
jgi:hypothetical protein